MNVTTKPTSHKSGSDSLYVLAHDPEAHRLSTEGSARAPRGTCPTPGTARPEGRTLSEGGLRVTQLYRSVCILAAMTDRPNAHDALLGATSELTYERGITATGVDAIAAQAGVTKRTLYQHFGSKDRLVAEALSDRSRRALLSLETNARRRSEETGDPVILALFDVIENALRTKTKGGCAFINASLEINQLGHPVHEAALAHLRAREALVHQLLVEAGAEDTDLAAQVVLLVDGAYAVGGSRRDPAAARHAKTAAAALLAIGRASETAKAGRGGFRSDG